MTATDADTVRIRPAKRADLLAVLGIEQQSFSQPWPYDAFERFLDAEAFLVALDGSGVLGYIVADRIPNHGQPIGHVKDLAVQPDRRGEGIGTQLLDRGLAALATAGVRRVKLEVRVGNHRARSLYTSFGFDIHHRVPRYYDDGEDAAVMVLDLGATDRFSVM
ncbi:MAG: ribosomal protein S18-alanine N-acetyltransferase [Halobacteriales archaeon]|nr:ribosomal protein S18-alanine N-acetyltransferase [Halobacteriales archaeon]